MPRTRTRVAAILAVAALLPTAAFAGEIDDARKQADRLAEEAAEAERQAEDYADARTDTQAAVEELAAQSDEAAEILAQQQDRLDEVERQLVKANEQLAVAEADAKTAMSEASTARRRAHQATQELQEAEGELDINADNRAAAVRDVYKYGPGIANPEMAAMYVADGTSPSELADTLHFLDVLLTDHSTLVERAVELADAASDAQGRADRTQQQAARQAREARAAQEVAAEQHARVLELMAAVENAMLAQQQTIAELTAQQTEAEEEVEALAAAEQQARRRSQEAADGADAAEAKAERLERERREREERERREREERERREREERERREREQPEDPAPAPTPGVDVTPINSALTRVGGITVSSSIANQLAALLNHARRDGIVLSGYGYRSIETTIRLRTINGCPDVWTSPPSSCRVPTARPGTSMHEKGLAIDFSWQGRTICFPNPPSACHGNAAYNWLAANASRYGLHGLSSEAWHFSTNGR